MVSPEHIILIKAGSESIFRKTVKHRYQIPPLGLLELGAFLRMHGYTVQIIDLIVEDHDAATLETALRAAGVTPLVVGISVYTDTSPASVEIAQFVKTVLPETTVVVGGPHPAFCAEEMLACAAIDFVVRGEGESTLIELLEALKYRGLQVSALDGLSFRGPGGSVTHTPDRAYVKALDVLPLPLIELQQGSGTFYVVSSRGCPARCMFCASRAYSGSGYRMHSAEWLFSLVYEGHKRARFDIMDILDDTFTANRTRTRRFCALLKSSGLRIRMRVKSRVDYIREDIVQVLAEAGCIAVHIGVESADSGVLLAIGKNITTDAIRRAIEMLVKHGVRADTSLMIGHACDTCETIEKTVILAAMLKRVGTVALGISTPYPGTALHRDADALGLKIAVTNWRKYDTLTPIYSTSRFGLNDLRKAHYLFDKCRDQLRGKPILTGELHAAYWEELDAWTASVAATRPGRSPAEVPPS